MLTGFVYCKIVNGTPGSAFYRVHVKDYNTTPSRQKLTILRTSQKTWKLKKRY